MKTIACIYCEGNDTKLAIVTKEKGSNKLKVLSTAAVDVVAPKVGAESTTPFSLDTEGLQLEGIDTNPEAAAGLLGEADSPSILAIAQAFKNINPAKVEFIPALTEPAIFYLIMREGRTLNLRKLLSL